MPLDFLDTEARARRKSVQSLLLKRRPKQIINPLLSSLHLNSNKLPQLKTKMTGAFLLFRKQALRTLKETNKSRALQAILAKQSSKHINLLKLSSHLKVATNQLTSESPMISSLQQVFQRLNRKANQRSTSLHQKVITKLLRRLSPRQVPRKVRSRLCSACSLCPCRALKNQLLNLSQNKIHLLKSSNSYLSPKNKLKRIFSSQSWS